MIIKIQITEKDLADDHKIWSTDNPQHFCHVQKNAITFAINRVLRPCYRSICDIEEFDIFYNDSLQKEFEVVVIKRNLKFTGKLPPIAIRILRNLAFYPTLKFTGEFELDIPEKFLKTNYE